MAFTVQLTGLSLSGKTAVGQRKTSSASSRIKSQGGGDGTRVRSIGQSLDASREEGEEIDQSKEGSPRLSPQLSRICHRISGGRRQKPKGHGEVGQEGFFLC